MPRVNFGKVRSPKNEFQPVPEGRYLVKLAEIEEDRTRNGDEMWKLRLVIQKGDHAGRFLFDNLVFSRKAIGRVKAVCASLGVDVTGEVNLTPEDLIGRQCMVATYVEDYQTSSGQIRQSNRIPWDGYEAVMASTGGSEDDDDLPF
jgi:hypothetical protein